MTAYYNEHDPFAAKWLRNLINEGLIAKGIVDDRSITEVKPSDLKGFTQCHFFAGIGVWSYALRLAGWCDDKPVWTGSPPCQPFSVAGKKKGVNDERHLWPVMLNLIRECKPSVIFGEQVEAAIKYSWLDAVQTDLEEIGYTFGAVGLPAAGFGAPHIRQRLYFVAYSTGKRLYRERILLQQARQNESDSEITRGSETCIVCTTPGPTNGFWRNADWLLCKDGRWRSVEPGTFPLADGASARVGRLRAYGNAIVSEVAKEFVKSFIEYENSVLQ